MNSTFHLTTELLWDIALQLEITVLSFLALQITGLSFSSIDSNYIYVQGVDYEVIMKFLNQFFLFS